MKRILQEYDITTQNTAVNILRNSLVHPKYKQQQSRETNAVYEICIQLKLCLSSCIYW